MYASNSGRLVLRPGATIAGAKVFTATMAQDRTRLGETMTAWIAANPELQITEINVTQSSDSAFHCVTLIAFYGT